MPLVKLACERPDRLGRSLSPWGCAEWARRLEADGLVDSLSTATVRRILTHHKRKPWRQHLWLSPKVPRNAAFRAQVEEICGLYTRLLPATAVVLRVEEKTNLQPRPRLAPTQPAAPGQPVRVEHEYRRVGALNLLAAFDTRTGRVYAVTAERKRPAEFILLLEKLDQEIAPRVTTIHVVLDNLRRHRGQQVRRWLAEHARFLFPFTPVHCSWMNQMEQWFSILPRKRLRIVAFASKAEWAERLQAFVAEWNERAHPFQWGTQSAAKIMAYCDRAMAA